jgi:hypothetical protein
VLVLHSTRNYKVHVGIGWLGGWFDQNAWKCESIISTSLWISCVDIFDTHMYIQYVCTRTVPYRTCMILELHVRVV